MHQSDFVAQQQNMKFVITLSILVIFWQFCDAKEVTKKLKKDLKALKTKYESIQLSMGMYILYSLYQRMMIQGHAYYRLISVSVLFSLF